MKSRAVFAWMAVIFTLFGATPIAWGVSYDAGADFSSASNPNPNGVWSQGYTAALGSALMLHNQFAPNYDTNIAAWYSANGAVLAKNNGSATIYGILPGQAALHPGSGNEYSVLRFTVPSAGSFTVAAQFFQGDSGDTDANILRNSNTASPLLFAATTDTNPSYNAVLEFQAGDTLDFVVGSKGSYFGDTTPLQLTITSAPSSASGLRTSARYSITTEIADAGGRRAVSSSYTNDGSLGGVAGISTVAAPAETAKHGYVGQLYDLASGVFLTSLPATINEGGTRQLIAARNLDDGTGLVLDPVTVAWSVLAGPITSISAGGVATASTIYQNTFATVQGVASGFTATRALSVLNTSVDNFGSYSADGVDDAWQVQYFGQPPNASAGPNADVSGTGQTNLFKFLAGLNPLDPTSRFALRVAPVPDPAHPGQFLPSQKNLIFSPRLSGRTYTVEYRADLLTGN